MDYFPNESVFAGLGYINSKFQMFSKKCANSRKLSAFFFAAPANWGFMEPESVVLSSPHPHPVSDAPQRARS